MNLATLGAGVTSLKVLNLANCDIVDLSELGRPGLLHRIEEIIIAGNPTAVFGSRSLYFETGAQLLLFLELIENNCQYIDINTGILNRF